jgi:hypothetical protein
MPELEHRDYPGAPRRIRNLSRCQYAADRKSVEVRIQRFIAAV